MGASARSSIQSSPAFLCWGGLDLPSCRHVGEGHCSHRCHILQGSQAEVGQHGVGLPDGLQGTLPTLPSGQAVRAHHQFVRRIAAPKAHPRSVRFFLRELWEVCQLHDAELVFALFQYCFDMFVRHHNLRLKISLSPRPYRCHCKTFEVCFGRW